MRPKVLKNIYLHFNLHGWRIKESSDPIIGY